MKLNSFETFLDSISKKPLYVLDKNLPLTTYLQIDISENNKDLLEFNISSSFEWQKYIELYLRKKNAKVAFGGYLEKRNIYDRSNYFKNKSKENQRNIHLGVDLWSKENTKVLAVLDGEVHSFKNNNNFGDYGPTIILKHQIKNKIFYTLYGHLSLASIKEIKVGDKFLKGNVIGFLGEASVNGDYAPHLHFQIIRNLEENFGDYPGVSSPKTINFYKKNCPNPNFLLKLPI